MSTFIGYLSTRLSGAVGFSPQVDSCICIAAFRASLRRLLKLVLDWVIRVTFCKGTTFAEREVVAKVSKISTISLFKVCEPNRHALRINANKVTPERL